MSTQLDTVSGAYWSGIREHFFTAVEPEPEPEPGMSAEDLDDMGLEEFGERRGQLGIHHASTDIRSSNGVGLSSTDVQSGFPSWNSPQQPDEEITFTDLDHYATEERAAAGIRTASDIFGVPQRQYRVNRSSWGVE